MAVLDLPLGAELASSVAVLVVGNTVALMYGDQHERFFLEGDPRYSYPNMADTVSSVELLVLSLLFPMALLLLLPFLVAKAAPDTQANAPRAALRLATALFLGLGLTEFVTNVTKVYVGQLRPDFFAACGYPQVDGVYGTPGVVGDLSKCTSDEGEVEYLTRSFPSGHASLSMMGMGYLALCLFHALSAVFAKPHWRVPVVVLSVWPAFVAVWVAASRVRDYRHHPADVVAGACLGGAIALGTFNAYFGRELAQKKESTASLGQALI